MLLLGLSFNSAVAQPKLALTPHGSGATIVSLKGADTDRAIAVLRVELDDAVEHCIRSNRGDEDAISSDKIAQCAKETMRDWRPVTRRAFYARSTVYTEFGSFSLISKEIEAASTLDGKPYRPVRSNWKDHKTGEIRENSSVGGTSIILETFKALCPAQYAWWFKGYNPH